MKFKAACIQLRARDYANGKDSINTAISMAEEAARKGSSLIVFPEVIYPGYFLGKDEPTQEELDMVIGVFREKAKELKIYMAVGLVEREGDSLYNTAFLLDPKGNIAGKARKGFLWHFDRLWFKKGDIAPVFDTELGKIGIIICADARHPDICRKLSLMGAKIIIDCTNWVSVGADEKTLTNPQVEYMIPVRAVENNLWIIAANKVGIERNSIIYCGNSMVVNNKGEYIARASSHLEEVLIGEVTLDDDISPLPYDLRGKAEIMKDENPVIPGHLTQYFGLIQGSHSLEKDQILRMVEDMDLQRCGVVVLPPSKKVEEGNISREMVETWRTLRSKIFLKSKDSIMMNSNGKFIKVYQKGGSLNPLNLSFGKLGFLIDDEVIIPELARGWMKKGVDCILWLGESSLEKYPKFLQTRSSENRVFMAANLNTKDGYWASVANPMGQIIATGLKGKGHGFGCQMDLAISRCKEIVPLTDVREEILCL